VLRLRNLDEIK